MPDFSFIILTYNEEIHLPRLLDSIQLLNAEVFIIDSFSTDKTLEIARAHNCTILQNKFINHPLQWDFALKQCNVQTSWIIGLDADQYLSKSLFEYLYKFKNDNIAPDINAIYFNRHNYFQGSRLKYGGYRNFYLLKMFRTGLGYSDLNEKMDHRFVVPGKSIRLRNAVLIENNLKENNIDFWIQKHLKYSELVAQQEIDARRENNITTEKPNLFGSINQQKKWFKQVWMNLPLFVRPFLYFIYRYFFRFGFLENKTGRTFHYLQAFWFRYIVDYKIYKAHKKEHYKNKN